MFHRFDHTLSCDNTESTGQAEESADKMIDEKGHDHGDSEQIELNNVKNGKWNLNDGSHSKNGERCRIVQRI